MNPILFGSSRRTLFGVHAPASARRLRTGAVICPPFGQEYLRSHRACRFLSDKLSRAGLDVLRFDYYGTGDSAGESDEVTLSGCTDDAVQAVEELSAAAAVRDVIVIGIRLGAAIALNAARQIGAANRAVLWDPVLDGTAYLAELLRNAHAYPNTVDTMFTQGFPMTPKLRQEIDVLAQSTLPPDIQRSLVITGEDRRISVPVHSSGATPDLFTYDGPPLWTEYGDLGVGVLPMSTIDHIVRWCS